MTGITAYGAYIPRLRLSRLAIYQAMGWFAPALIMVAQGERSMCNFDEDSLTMAVAAARDCLTGMDKRAVDAAYLCSTTLPFADRQNAELGALPLMPISVRTSGETRESQIRDWFTWDDSIIVFEIKGKDLTALLKLARDQAAREAQGLPAPPGEFPFVLAGAPEGRVHGAQIQPEAAYRALRAALGLPIV